MKVFKVTLMIIDQDGLGEQGVRDVLVDTSYPNDCIAPDVVSIESRDIEWSDGHPLNSVGKWKETFEELFK